MIVAGAALAEYAKDVLDHDHARVDEDPEVDRAQRQEIHRDVARVEQQECGRERQRDRRRDDQSGPHAAQEQHQDQRHQEHAEHQVVLDRVRGERDQIGAVVVRVDLDVARQDVVVEELRHRVHALEHGLRRVAGA